ncbi:hypothetical protein ACT91Q_05810, partial [Brevibacillus thermoruber]|uniref:hypothetical protein n=1 Tax=Brevibacillus thermoruber TaxID=33942 RepID=UPI0040426178
SSELGPNSVATVRSVSGASSTISPLSLTAIGVYTKLLTDPGKATEYGHANCLSIQFITGWF